MWKSSLQENHISITLLFWVRFMQNLPPRIVVFKRFQLKLCDGKEVVLHNVEVVKDKEQRHVVHLIGNPIKVSLVSVGRREELKIRKGVRKVYIPELGRKVPANIVVGGSYRSQRFIVRAFSSEAGINGTAVAQLPKFIQKLLK